MLGALIPSLPVLGGAVGGALGSLGLGGIIDDVFGGGGNTQSQMPPPGSMGPPAPSGTGGRQYRGYKQVYDASGRLVWVRAPKRKRRRPIVTNAEIAQISALKAVLGNGATFKETLAVRMAKV